MTRWKLVGTVVVLVMLACVIAACQTNPTPDVAGLGDVYQSVQNLRVKGQLRSEGMVDIAIPTSLPTATPGIMINANGLSNPLEIRKATTPVFYVDVDGNVTYTGMTSAGGLTSAAAGIAAPTSVATATPAFFVDSLGVSNLFEVRDAATPVFAINNGGAIVAAGAGTWAGAQTLNGVLTANEAVLVKATPATTATPQFAIKSVGAGQALEVQNSGATPVAQISGAGAATFSGALLYSGTKSPLAYGTAGKTLVVGSNTITGTLAVTHGLSTAIAGAGSSMNANQAAGAALCSVTYSGTTVTVKVWKTDFTTAGDVGALVNWWVLGN